MFNTAILTGIYGYLILLLGLLGLLSKGVIFGATLVFSGIAVFVFRKEILKLRILDEIKKQNIFFYLLAAILLLQALVNLIGALGPELAFDALWYHLTLPKLYLLNNAFYFIPGKTLYYSTMPQLTEMFYLASMALQSEILAKVVHFLFGIGICFAIYKIARKFTTREFSLLAVVIFYGNLVVAWESITAYIDLAKAFFELLSFWAFLLFTERPNKKWLIYSGVMMGLAISTKTLSLGTFALMLVFIFLALAKHSKGAGHIRQKILNIFKGLMFYIAPALFLPLPWFTHAFLNRGSPFYPVFGDLEGDTRISPLNPVNFFSDLWQVFTHAADPISPVYIVFLPLLFLFFKKFSYKAKVIFYFSAALIILWYLTPRTGGGRFLVSSLPTLSILLVLILDFLRSQKILFKISIIFIIFISVTTIFFRGAANFRYLNYILGKESKEAFLARYLEFDKGNFADIDSFFAKNIKSSDRVLLYGFHNLFYVNFPFIDGSWIKKGDRFNYIAVKEGELPQVFKNWKMIYSNALTGVKLYSSGGDFWIY